MARVRRVTAMTTRTKINLWLALSWLGAFGPAWGLIGEHALPFVATGAIVSALIALTLAVLDVAAAIVKASGPKSITLTNSFERSTP
jgi:hypothetical protein